MNKIKNNTAMDETIYLNVLRTDAGLALLKEVIERNASIDVDEISIVFPEFNDKEEYVLGNRIGLCVLSSDKKIYVEANAVYSKEQLESYQDDFAKTQKERRKEYDECVQLNFKMNGASDYNEDDEDFIKILENIYNEKLNEKDFDDVFKVLKEYFRYLVALYSTCEELDEHHKNDIIINNFKNELKRIINDEKFKKWVKEVK